MNKRFVLREKLEIPKINAIALPTIFLIMLFFFVMFTNIRKDKIKIGEVNAPLATELSALGKKAIVTTIYIGKPKGRVHSAHRIQLNNQVMTIAQVENYMKTKRTTLKADEYSLMTVMLKIDKDTPMGIVSDLKQALRRANVLNIFYSARPE